MVTFGIQGAETGLLRPKEKSDAQKSCEAKGGTWDEATKTCKLPQTEIPNQSTKDSKPLPAARTGEFDRARGGFVTNDDRLFPTDNPDFIPETEQFNKTTFNPDGTVTVKKGNTIETLTQEEHNTLINRQGVNTSRVESLRNTPNEKEQQLLNTISQIGQVGDLANAFEAPINLGQAATAGAVTAIPSIAGGIATGAVSGAVGGPIGVVGGAVIGGVAGFISGTLRNIDEQQSGELAAAKDELSSAKTNMRTLAMLATQNPANADIYIRQYNDQLTRVYQSRRQTQAEVQGNLNSFMEDGREQLSDFDTFLQDGGTADIYGQKLEQAISLGLPLSIVGEDLILESIE